MIDIMDPNIDSAPHAVPVPVSVPDAAPEIDSVGQGMRTLAAQHRTLVLGAWAVAFVPAAGLFWYFFILFGDNASAGSIFFLFVPFALPLFVYSYFAGKARHEMVMQIALSFGYAYEASAPMSSVSGAIFSRGNGRRIYDILSGTYRECPIRMFSYEYTVQEGKHSQTFHDTVCELDYPAPLPHIVLLRHELLRLSADVGLFSGLGSLQKTELEGDFRNYFDLYVDAGAQIQIREILTPDVMQDLIETFTGHDLEIKDFKIYLLQHGALSTRAGYLALHQLADMLIDKLLPGLGTAARDGVPAA